MHKNGRPTNVSCVKSDIRIEDILLTICIGTKDKNLINAISVQKDSHGEVDVDDTCQYIQMRDHLHVMYARKRSEIVCF